MKIKSYHDLEVWQKSMDFVVACYEVTGKLPSSEKYGLANQLRRAAVSVPGNIAEGRSRQYVKEFLQHLSIAYGSLAEVETYLQISVRLNYLSETTVEALMKKTSEIGRMINGLRKSLTKK